MKVNLLSKLAILGFIGLMSTSVFATNISCNTDAENMIKALRDGNIKTQDNKVEFIEGRTKISDVKNTSATICEATAHAAHRNTNYTIQWNMGNWKSFTAQAK